MCILIPNFMKIARMTVEISHLTFFKMPTVRHLGFLNDNFEQLVSSGGGLIYMCRHAKFCQNEPNGL